MGIKRHVHTTPQHLFLTRETDIHVNRIWESFELGEHDHEFMEFNYVSEGSGYQHIEGQVIPVTKGDLFLLPIGASHVFRPGSISPQRRHLLVYNCLFGNEFRSKLETASGGQREILSMLDGTEENRWFHWKDQDGTFQKIFNILYEEFIRKGPYYQLLMQSELLKLLIYLTRQQSGGTAIGQQGKREEGLDQTVEWIKQHCTEGISIRQAAQHAGLSERQFRRRFQARTGMSYTDFVHRERIERICSLLETTDEPVSAIAAKAGYQDIKFFNRLFKRKTGVTPRQYRRSALQHASPMGGPSR
ncbi:MAG: transcriptional regulator, AraC family [Paenibacillaceae bacterium]|jgi:AraC family L-rhamnose operon transcriptional activator RhaR|nr:transcriptional regulator, AraC family [Paenibacillaceae bacterium]